MTHDFEKALAAMPDSYDYGVMTRYFAKHKTALEAALQAAIAAQNVAGDLGEVIERCENTKHLHGARGYYAPEDIDSLINAARLHAQSQKEVQALDCGVDDVENPPEYTELREAVVKALAALRGLGE